MNKLTMDNNTQINNKQKELENNSGLKEEQVPEVTNKEKFSALIESFAIKKEAGFIAMTSSSSALGDEVSKNRRNPEEKDFITRVRK